jgi:NitT/TauT family transport system ATP-binding protein
LATESPSSEATALKPPLVEFERVSFSYVPGVPVLEDVSLTIREGSVLGIVGPSGCGKSTVLSILAGLHRPSSGRVSWSPEASGKDRHKLAMVFQKDTLLPWLTASDNAGLHFRFRNSRTPKAEARSRVAGLMKMAGLEGSEGKFPYQLSGGMRRRVAFLTAVAPQPRTLLLDEPFSSLDEPTRVGIHQDVLKIIKSLGITVVLVTHDLAEAISLCDDVVILSTRPARVFKQHRVPFGNEREMLKLRQTAEFLSLYATLWEQLSVQIRRGDHTFDTAREQAP